MFHRIYNKRLSSDLFAAELCAGGAVVAVVACTFGFEIVGRLSAAAARSARNRSNSVLVKLSSALPPSCHQNKKIINTYFEQNFKYD